MGNKIKKIKISSSSDSVSMVGSVINNAIFSRAIDNIEMLDDCLVDEIIDPVEYSWDELYNINKQEVVEEWLQSNNYFPKYEFSDEEILEIARLCAQEQGSSNLEGIAAEASLMANLFELYKYESKFEGKVATTEDAFIKFLKTPVSENGWFSNAKKIMEYGSDDNPVYPNTENGKKIIETVSSILNGGKRTLPKYIDEHDCFGDYVYVANNGEDIGNYSNRESYKEGLTVIKNCYDSTYTFYSFPGGDSGDSFGYTDYAGSFRDKYGDISYDYKTGSLQYDDEQLKIIFGEQELRIIEEEATRRTAVVMDGKN